MYADSLLVHVLSQGHACKLSGINEGMGGWVTVHILGSGGMLQKLFEINYVCDERASGAI